MEVGIRLVNWIFAYEIFARSGAPIEPGFTEFFLWGLALHLDYVMGHLERQATFSGNHYLADVCAVVVGAAFMPASPRNDRRLE